MTRVWSRRDYVILRRSDPIHPFSNRPEALNVGWLERSHIFAIGEVGEELIEKLRELAAARAVNQTRGHHSCSLCENPAQPIVQWRNAVRSLGSAEIWIAGKRGVRYACPDMIIHYVEVHHYLPPAEFLEALHDARIGEPGHSPSRT